MNTNKNLHFVYCFDSNFNSQAFASMSSLLDNVSEKVNISILHNNLETINVIPQYIENHDRLLKMSKFQFKHFDIDFPNLEDSHVSQATYYRLFIDQYIDKEENFVIYIDADMICISDPVELIKDAVATLNIDNLALGAKTEILRNLTEQEIEIYMQKTFFKKYWPFDRLGIKDKYFNAGFMIINLNLWKKNLVFEKLITRMSEIKNDIVSWDQDVLNSFFDGEYLELPYKFNHFARNYNFNEKEILFLHFYGSKKPWTTDGVFESSAEIYHSNYRKVHNKKYHIKNAWRRHSLYQFLKNVLNLNILKLKFPISYTKELLISLVIKN